MSNFSSERKYNMIASHVDSFISVLMSGENPVLKIYESKADKQIFDLLIAAQNLALDIAISFEDKSKENS